MDARMSDDPPQTTSKVLIVDDSRIVRASLIKHIRGHFEFREEPDGEAGWQTLVVDPSIALVLTDIGMPQIDGYGLLERIRESKLARLQNMPVVIISGDEDDAAKEKARQLGANDFVTKGIGSAELVARIDSLLRLAHTARDLAESRDALAAQSLLDPLSGLPTQSYFKQHGAQEIALARRHQGDISVMVIEIDGFAAFAARYGAAVAKTVARKLSSMLATKVRQEDTVAELAEGQFSVLSPVTDLVGCCAFALRMQKVVEKLVMTYRGESISISITAGISSSSADGLSSISHLIGIAAKRAQAGQAAGGNRVIGDKGEVTQATIDRCMKQVVSVDRMLAFLRAGDPGAVTDRLPDVILTLLPLLELIESQVHCGIPLEQMKQYKGPSEAKNDAGKND
jgi:diguanylate cyclase (GGDEF)-like protein